MCEHPVPSSCRTCKQGKCTSEDELENIHEQARKMYALTAEVKFMQCCCKRIIISKKFSNVLKH